MKKSLFTRTLAGISALALAASAASCGKDSTEVKEPKKGSEEIKNAARAEKLSDAEFNYVNAMTFVAAQEKLVVAASDADYKYGIYVSDKDASVFEKLPIDFAENDMYSNSQTAVAPDGTIAVYTNTTDYGDFELPDYDDPDFDYETFDWEAMEEAATYSSSIALYDIDGNKLSSFDVDMPEEDASSGKYGYGYGGYGVSTFLVTDKDTVLYSAYNDSGNQTLTSFSADGKKKGEFKFGENDWVNNYCITSDGKIAVSIYGDSGDSEVMIIDPQSMSAEGDRINCSETGDYMNSMFAGFGDTLFYFTTTEGVFGYSSDGKIEEKVNWIDSGMSSYDSGSLVAVGEDEFIMYSYDYDVSEGAFSKLSRIDSSEFENTTIITLAVLYDDYQLTKAVNDFNNSNTDYRIRISNYSKYDDYEYVDGQDMPIVNNTSADQLKKDIIAGNSPDMIYCYDRATIDVLAKKGAFADLYDYMGKDGTLSKDDLMPNLLAALETDGKLYSIAPGFNVSTYAIKKKFCDKDSWTVNDLIDIYHSLPDGAKLFEWGNSKENVFNMFLYACSSFVDYKSGTCNFDSQEFIDILNFCNEFPDEEQESINWETATEEEMENYYREQEYMFRDDKALIYQMSLSWMRDYKETKVGRFGEDINLIGAPTLNGSGGAIINIYDSMAILASSPSKDACWKFICTLFDEDYQEKNYSYNTSAVKSVFEKQLEELKEKPYYLDENNKKVEYDDVYYLNDEEITIDPFTQDEIDFMRDVIMNADTLGGSYSTDVSVIIDEEIQPFFKGEKTAEEAAAMIQNRVSILVSEQS